MTWFAFLDVIISEIEQRFANDSFKPIIRVENLLMLVSRGLLFGEKFKEVLQFNNDYDYILHAQLVILSDKKNNKK